MWPNPQFPADLITFTEEILNWKLHFLCSDTDESEHMDTKNLEWKLARKMLRVKASFPKVSVEMS